MGYEYMPPEAYLCPADVAEVVMACRDLVTAFTQQKNLSEEWVDVLGPMVCSPPSLEVAHDQYKTIQRAMAKCMRAASVDESGPELLARRKFAV